MSNDYEFFIKSILNNYKNENKISYSKTGVFDTFHEPFLFYIKSKTSILLKEINGKNSLRLEQDKILQEIMEYSKSSLLEISLKVLIGELHEQKTNNMLKGATKEERYKYFDDSFLDITNINYILNKYQALNYLIYIRLNSIVNLISEALTRLSENIVNIREKISGKFYMLNSITLNTGDTHNGGKSVIIFNFDNDEKVVYKPHGLSGDTAIEDIYDFINSKKFLKTKMNHVKTIDKVNYGFQEFIKYAECTENDEAINYFYKIGVLLSLFTILKSSDIHSENMIVNKDNPTLIDLETLLTNKRSFNFDDNITLSYMMQIGDSVLGNLLLPQNFETSIIDIDVSGLSGEGGQTSKKIYSFVLENQGTDEICLERKFVVSQENNNRISLNGVKLDPLDYIDNIEDGFKECYTLINENKKQFIETINKIFEVGRYRQVLRPTYIYAKYLDAAHHKNFMKSIDDRLNLFKNISVNDIAATNTLANDKKVLGELNSLLDDDIPYFSSDYCSKNLYINDKEAIEDYYEVSLKELLEERIMALNDKNLDLQLGYIRNSLLSTRNDLFSKTADKGEKINIVKEDIMESLKNMGDFIYDKAIFSNDKSKCTYLNINFSGDKSYLGPLSYTLYDGAGLTLFLYALANETNDKKYEELAKATLNGLEEMTPLEAEVIAKSAFSGITSFIYLYYNLSVMLDSKEYYDKYLKSLNLLNKHEITDDESLDVIGGAAGIVIALINIYKQDKNKMALDIAKRYGTFLYKKLQNDSEHLSGFSHGYSGFALAFYMLGATINNKEYSKFANSIIEQEDKLYRQESKNWIDLRSSDDSSCIYWCHGAPGILLARTKALRYIQNKDSEILKHKLDGALDTLVNRGLKRNQSHSICHGLLGNLDILLTVSEEFLDKDLLNIYKSSFCKTLDWLIEDGIRYGVYNASAILTFMTGLSGIGYSMLRYVNPNYPSVLALDTMKKDVS